MHRYLHIKQPQSPAYHRANEPCEHPMSTSDAKTWAAEELADEDLKPGTLVMVTLHEVRRDEQPTMWVFRTPPATTLTLQDEIVF